ncbi:hypothetical protein D5F01_LYC15384 [Larimichthys crocea]|uniref:Uncharacterized protein n=1 Tax=Larimichthys crocea TaxID=215358 RepID=A0A6G0I2Z3_LARCR|nr:hypothetical protein D5F01_LYC15384 [Larimichthys crocea]
MVGNPPQTLPPEFRGDVTLSQQNKTTPTTDCKTAKACLDTSNYNHSPELSPPQQPNNAPMSGSALTSSEKEQTKGLRPLNSRLMAAGSSQLRSGQVVSPNDCPVKLCQCSDSSEDWKWQNSGAILDHRLSTRLGNSRLIFPTKPRLFREKSHKDLQRQRVPQLQKNQSFQSAHHSPSKPEDDKWERIKSPLSNLASIVKQQALETTALTGEGNTQTSPVASRKADALSPLAGSQDTHSKHTSAFEYPPYWSVERWPGVPFSRGFNSSCEAAQ